MSMLPVSSTRTERQGPTSACVSSEAPSASEVFHLAGGRVPGPDPQGRSYQTYASFSDPDGNGWLLQEIKTRLPGREWED